MKKRMLALATMAIMLISLFSAPFVYGKYTTTITVTEDLDLTIEGEQAVAKTKYSLFYHSFNADGDYIYKQEVLYGDDTVIDIIPPPTSEENPYLSESNRNFIGWTVSGIDAVHHQSNVKRYAPNGMGVAKELTNYEVLSQVTTGELWEEQSWEENYKSNYWTDSDGNPIIHLFDIYDSPVWTAQAYPGMAVGTGNSLNHFWFACDMLYVQDGKTLIKTFGDSDLGSATGSYSFREEIDKGDGKISCYFHPGITIAFTTGERKYYTSLSSTQRTAKYYTMIDDTSGYDYSKRTEQMVAPDRDFSSYFVNETPSNAQANPPSTDSGGGGCFASDTLITLANGEKAPIESLTAGDMLRVYDHEKGNYAAAEILFIEEDGFDEYDVINLSFSDGSSSKFIYEHGLFDLTLNEYVYLTPDNYAQFIGHTFATEQEGGFGEVTLTDAYVEKEYTGCYSLTTNYHLNYFVDGRFSMPGGIYGLFNFFEYDEDLKYEEEAMARDIERYGLYTAADFEGYLPEEVFNGIFPVPYLKVSVGKGLITYDGILAIIERYVVGHGLLEKLN